MTDSKIEMHFESGSNNTIFNNSRINVAGDFYTTQAPQQARRNEQQVENLLHELMEATDETGKKIMVNQQMWYAVYRVFSERLDYVSNMSQFALKMSNLGMDKVNPPCKADSIRKALRSVIKLSNSKVAEWSEHTQRGEAYVKQWKVAQWLLDRI